MFYKLGILQWLRRVMSSEQEVVAGWPYMAELEEKDRELWAFRWENINCMNTCRHLDDDQLLTATLIKARSLSHVPCLVFRSPNKQINPKIRSHLSRRGGPEPTKNFHGLRVSGLVVGPRRSLSQTATDHILFLLARIYCSTSPSWGPYLSVRVF